jgi:hypothetical protein
MFIKMNELKKNNEIYFKKKETSNMVYKLNHYDRSTKSYSCSSVDDICHEVFIKSNKLVFVGFTY